MNENEVLYVIEEDKGDGWTRVRKHSGVEGYVPTSYVDITLEKNSKGAVTYIWHHPRQHHLVMSSYMGECMSDLPWLIKCSSADCHMLLFTVWAQGQTHTHTHTVESDCISSALRLCCSGSICRIVEIFIAFYSILISVFNHQTEQNT